MGFEIVIVALAEALLKELFEFAAEGLKKRKSPRKELLRALQIAIAEGIARYLQEPHDGVVGQALERRELWEGDVERELAKLVGPAGSEPDVDLIAQRWATEIPGVAIDELRGEAARLVERIRFELRASPVVRPVLDSANLAEVASRGLATVAHLKSVIERLNAITSLDHGQFREILGVLDQGAPDLGELIWKGQEAWLAQALTTGIVMRSWLLREVRKSIKNMPSGYVLIHGEPGIGKSTFVAQLTTQRGAILHVNSRLGGPRDARSMRRNVGAQLALRHRVARAIRTGDLDDGGLLMDLMRRAGGGSDEPVVIAIDALDEAERPTPGGSPLGLPAQLPPNVYVIATARPHVKPWWTGSGETLSIMPAGQLNTSDARAFVWTRIRTGIGDALAQRSGIDRPGLVKQLVTLSEGNFMYLRHALDDLEHERGIPQRVSEYPRGLANYYSAHLEQMGLDAVSERGLAVLYLLARLDVRATRKRIAALLRVKTVQVQHDLDRWREFLDVEIEDSEPVYSLYHAAFADFVLTTPLISAVREELSDLDDRIAQQGLDLLYDGN